MLQAQIKKAQMFRRKCYRRKSLGASKAMPPFVPKIRLTKMDFNTLEIFSAKSMSIFSKKILLEMNPIKKINRSLTP